VKEKEFKERKQTEEKTGKIAEEEFESKERGIRFTGFKAKEVCWRVPLCREIGKGKELSEKERELLEKEKKEFPSKLKKEEEWKPKAGEEKSKKPEISREETKAETKDIKEGASLEQREESPEHHEQGVEGGGGAWKEHQGKKSKEKRRIEKEEERKRLEVVKETEFKRAEAPPTFAPAKSGVTSK